MTRQINGYTIETYGGFITVKHWTVFDKDDRQIATYFRYGDAKKACLNGNFDNGFKGKLY